LDEQTYDHLFLAIAAAQKAFPTKIQLLNFLKNYQI